MPLPRPNTRPLLLACAALLACAVLYVAHLRTRDLAPAFDTVDARATGSFAPDGWYPGDPLAHAAPGLRAWGSWSGDDALTGTIALGPFPAPRILRFGLGGYLTTAGNTLRIERTDTAQHLAVTHPPVGERWQLCEITLPPDWLGRPIRLVGTDQATAVGGWFALTEPIRGGRGQGNNALLDTFAAWSINGLLLALLYFAAARQLAARAALPPHWLPLVAGAIVALGGYVVYWAYFLHVVLGWILTAALYLAALLDLLRSRLSISPSLRLSVSPSSATPDLRTVTALLVSVGAFHLAVLHLFPTTHDFYTLAANRFREALPGDNALSHMYAERLFAGQPPKNSADDWQSSDRPPLQIGWQLLTWPAGKLLQLDRRTVSGTSAVWFQLLWVAAAYGLLRTFAVSSRRAAGWIAVFALAGFFVQNTTFTWPKLSAAAFALAAVALLFRNRPPQPTTFNRPQPATFNLPQPATLPPPQPATFNLPQPATFNFQLAASAALAALAWLSHGGVAFSFLALLPFLLWQAWQRFRTRPRSLDIGPWSLVIGHWPSLIRASALFAALVLPWLAYQKIYDPPGNLLLKWHFGGQTEYDARGVLETIRDGYAQLGWEKAWENKVTNFHSQVFGNWPLLFDVSAATQVERRNHEFFHTARALTWWPLLAAFAIALTRRPLLRTSPSLRLSVPPSLLPIFTPDLLALAGWLAATIVVWCLLMFGTYSASIHHGSYALTIGLFVLFTVLLERSGRGWLLAVAVLQTITFATTWAVSNSVISGPPAGLPIVLATAAPLAWFLLRSFRTEPNSTPAPSLEPPPTSPPSATRSLVLGPWSLVLAVAAIAAAAALRKPHALHTPQLWAEDGAVFLAENDLHGLAAFGLPYAGYLHTLPRLIAWIASLALDPAWWPAFYNGVAFLIWVAVIARLFSPRFDLPGKPWLALAMLAVPHTGEVFFNVTNLQWITAFVLIQQLLITPPATRAQRVSDFLILALVTLTGPFGLAFLPLFAVRALLAARDPHARRWDPRRLLAPAPRSVVTAFLVVLTGAALQAWFVVQQIPAADTPAPAAGFQLWPTLVILARRLVVMPLLGHPLALSLSPIAIAAFGGTFLAALFGWLLRPHPLRRPRLLVLGAFALITLAGLYRTRPDTWPSDDLNFADRYFYIPRVLLAWLLIWEFHATPRLVSHLARIACVLALLVHVRDYTLRAPTDYEWAKHVDPIRQGVPAQIPTLPEGWVLDYRGRAQ